jgi:uncharacterized membrane protein
MQARGDDLMETMEKGRRRVSHSGFFAGTAFSLAFFILLVAPTAVAAADPYELQNLLITVYEDGAVRAYSEYSVNILFPSVDIALLGDTYLDVVVTDAAGIPLSYSTISGGISVSTLGEADVDVAYTTHDITAKSGKYWTVNFTSPIPAWIAFPSGASIISLSSIPDTIDNSDGRTLLLMPAGGIAVVYVLSVLGTPDHAFVVISDAESMIDVIQAAGINASQAETILAEAKDAFDSGNYVGAEELAVVAKSLALQTNATAYQASAMIATAGGAISNAESEGRTVGLGDARSLLSQANSQYAAGDYAASLSSATEAGARAAAAQTVVQAYFPYISIALVAVTAIAIALALKGRGNKKGFKGYVKESHDVDLARIAKERQLREDDFKLMEVLAENGGEAFESLVRERFDLPKTTIWRMAKRLEKDGYISVETVAGQNLLKVRPEYLKK